MQTTKFEAVALVVLMVMLVSVFVLSVNMYDDIEANTNDGALSVFAGAVREYFDGDGAVAAFFKVEDEKPACDNEKMAAEAAAYIERYNEIYANNK